jgi:hypothetical protein
VNATRARIASLDQGAIPTIACFNKAKTPLGVDFGLLIRALQVYVNRHVEPVWRTRAKLVKSTDFVPGAWAMVFLDDADQPGALAYHDLTPDGLPEAKVFVRTTLQNNDLVSTSASHELVEMLVDPGINLMTTGPDPKATYAYETADPVEQYAFALDRIPMSNFVYPSYFETFRAPGSVPFDHLRVVSAPFQILPGGYQAVFKNGVWSQQFGSAEKEQAFAREDRRGSRTEQRAAGILKRADTGEIARAA